MSEPTQKVWVIRHGQTTWSLNGRHTGTTDLPLTDTGRQSASQLAPILAPQNIPLVLTSPLSRARETCQRAGLGDRMQLEPDLTEWDYGDYEGLTTPQIRQAVPGWTVFTHPCPGGETARQIGERIDRVIARIRATDGDAAVFAHGHSLRVFAARWLNLDPADGRHLALDTGTLNLLGYQHADPAILQWNAPPRKLPPHDPPKK